MEQVKALIECAATSIFRSLSLLRKLELPLTPVFTSTQHPNDQVMISPKGSLKASLLVHYFKLLKPVDEAEVLVVRMKAYDLVLSLPWLRPETRKSPRPNVN